MRNLTFAIIVISALAFATFLVTNVDVSNYPKIVVTALADVPDPENAEYVAYESGKGFKVTYLGLLDRSSSAKIDIVFVFDITGSMDDEIADMIAKSRDFASEIARGGFDYRFSLVTFRDSVVKGDYGFTKDVNEFKRWLSRLSASGGGDTPEAALDALMYALRLSFRDDAQKVLILITDAPYHYRGDGSGYSKYTAEDVRKMLKMRGATLYSVSPDSKAYRDLVVGFGKIFDIHSRAGFRSIIDEIAKAIRSQFRLSYVAEEKSPGEEVKFTIKAFYNGERGRKMLEAAGTYTVPPRSKVEEHEIVAEGYGYVDPTKPQQQAILLARRAAELDAKRQILEFIKGVKIDSETTIKDMMVASDKVRSEVEGYVMGGEIVDESYDQDFGVYSVKVKVNFKYIVDKISGKPTYAYSFTKKIVIARGAVAINKRIRPASRAVLLARRGAIVDAQRKLLEAIKGIHIYANTTVDDLSEVHDELVARVEGVIKGAVIIDEMKKHDDLATIFKKGYYWVTMAVPLDKEGMEYLKQKYGVFGGGTLVGILDKYVERESAEIETPSKKPKVGKYTLFVVDATKQGVMMSVFGYKLISKEGKVVFTPSMVEDPTILPMDYAETMAEVESKYPGEKLFVVKAAKVNLYDGEIYLDENYDTLYSVLVDQGLAKMGKIVVVGIGKSVKGGK